MSAPAQLTSVTRSAPPGARKLRCWVNSRKSLLLHLIRLICVTLYRKSLPYTVDHVHLLPEPHAPQPHKDAVVAIAIVVARQDHVALLARVGRANPVTYQVVAPPTEETVGIPGPGSSLAIADTRQLDDRAADAQSRDADLDWSRWR